MATCSTPIRSAQSRVCLRAKCSTGNSSGSWPRPLPVSCARSNALVGGLAVALGQVRRRRNRARFLPGEPPGRGRRRRLPRPKPAVEEAPAEAAAAEEAPTEEASVEEPAADEQDAAEEPTAEARARGSEAVTAEETSTARDQAEPASEPHKTTTQRTHRRRMSPRRRSDQGGLIDGNKYTRVDRGAEGHLGARARRAHQGA